jgi:7-keto-8-aminopelargonate synthetase-like enzyme
MKEAEALQQFGKTEVIYRGRTLAYFAGCDYFRLARHPAVNGAAARACRTVGLSVSASRRTTGNHVLYQTLERELAKFFNAPAAVLLPTGYMADLAVGQALAGQFTHALIDARSHGSLATAARFLDCPLITFPHRNAPELAKVIKNCGPDSRIILLTDGLFSHDGSVAPLREYLGVLPGNGVILVDDAHGAGVLGRHGRGTPEFAGVDRRRIIQTITLSKALGAYGGAVLASLELRDRIMATSNSFAGVTPFPLPLAAAALASMELLAANPNWRERLFANAARVKSALRESGVPLPDAPGPIIPLPECTAAQAKALQRALLAAEIYPSFIQYPGGPANGYFRFVISSAHTRRQLDSLAGVLVKHVPPWKS